MGSTVDTHTTPTVDSDTFWENDLQMHGMGLATGDLEVMVTLVVIVGMEDMGITLARDLLMLYLILMPVLKRMPFQKQQLVQKLMQMLHLGMDMGGSVDMDMVDTEVVIVMVGMDMGDMDMVAMDMLVMDIVAMDIILEKGLLNPLLMLMPVLNLQLMPLHGLDMGVIGDMDMDMDMEVSDMAMEATDTTLAKDLPMLMPAPNLKQRPLLGEDMVFIGDLVDMDMEMVMEGMDIVMWVMVMAI